MLRVQTLKPMNADTEITNNTNTHQPLALLTSDELAALLKVRRETIFKWRVRGLLPAICIGGRVLFHWPTVERALLARTQLLAEKGRHRRATKKQ
jgi:excisionase family DNA binding protein